MSGEETAPETPSRQPGAARAQRREWAIIVGLCVLILLGAAVRWARRRAGRVPVSILKVAGEEDFRLDLNTAGEAELRLLPGIGPKGAQQIVAWRKTHGPLRRVDDLLKAVPRLSKRRLEEIRPLARCGGGRKARGDQRTPRASPQAPDAR